ncbi:hypothetical protein caldi_10350 [Caldinitratiruptor microaerophilus]|uniref:CobQ/CobB/MinD/ParA nucleotide binding domain-containing protein n=1 Tax=Caldinitratiruptor microaerophilus TaxID=671077 RepID=A0AA35G7J4_9FIRM|nr:hypothetical protein caldi_10350 [Caldinitratiruptor microaerophilus]
MPQTGAGGVREVSEESEVWVATANPVTGTATDDLILHGLKIPAAVFPFQDALLAALRRQAPPAVLVLHELLPGPRDPVPFLARVRQAAPATRVVYLLAEGPRADPLIQALLDAGVYDFAIGSPGPDDLLRLIREPRSPAEVRHLYRRPAPAEAAGKPPQAPVWRGRRGLAGVLGRLRPAHALFPRSKGGAPMTSAAPRATFGVPQVDADVSPSVSTFSPRLLCAVWGPKGGVGTSTVAAGLAAAIAGTGRPVLALDLDLRAPALGVHFGLPSSGGLAPLHAEAVTAQAVRRHARPVPSVPGLCVLTAAPSDLLSLDGEEAGRLISACLDAWDVVVADCAHPLDEATTYAALRTAARTYLVVDQDRVAVEHAWEFLRLAAEAGVPRDGMRLVINRYFAGHGVPPQAIEEYLGLQARVVIPAEPLSYLRAIHEGTPVATRARGLGEDPWARLAADALGGEGAAASPRPGLLARLFRWQGAAGRG